MALFCLLYLCQARLESQDSIWCYNVILSCERLSYVLSDAKARIIDIMNETQSLPRSDLKENRPIMEKLEVPILKRSRFLGVGGLNLKKLMAETGECLQANCL